MTPTVRTAGPDDRRLLRDLRLAALAESPAAFGSSLEREAAFTDEQWGRWLSPLHWFVAEDGGRAVGLVGATMDGPHGPGSCQLLSMWVAPAARGRGAGAALVAAVGRWATDRGALSLVLGVAEGNEAARRFYLGLGFGPTGAREPLHRDPDRSVDQYALEL